MHKRILSFFAVIALMALTSCAYYFDESVQTVTVETPGAHNSVCYAYVDNVKYKINPPQTIPIKKDKDPMVIDCFAPGNRHKQVEFDSKVEPSTYLNTLNGIIPGTSWDYASDSMFRYPEVVYVDFRDIETSPNKLPRHNAPDLRKPSDYDLEEYLPTTPRLNADKYSKQPELVRRGQYEDDMFAGDDALTAKDMDPSKTLGKGDLEPTKGKGDLVPVESQRTPQAMSDGASNNGEGGPEVLFPLE